MNQARYPNLEPNGAGTTALVLGIISLVLSFAPPLFLLSFLLAPMAIIFGVVGLRKTGLPKRGAVAGIATAALAIVICVLWVVAYGAMIRADEAERQERQSEGNSS